MDKYYYCIEVLKDDKPTRSSGNIEVENMNAAIQKLISDGIINNKGYEFLELKRV